MNSGIICFYVSIYKHSTFPFYIVFLNTVMLVGDRQNSANGIQQCMTSFVNIGPIYCLPAIYGHKATENWSFLYKKLNY